MKNTFLQEAESGGIYFKYAKGKSRERGKEFHIYHEILYILGGDLELITESLHITVKPGMIIIIPKETYHQVLIHNDEDAYLRCVVNFSDSVSVLCDMSSVKIFASDSETDYLFGILKSNIENHNEIIFKSALALLTDALRRKTDIFDGGTNNNLVNSVIEYIGDNLCSKISAKELSRKFNLSTSSLQHIFKNEMQISLHSYILKKRLIFARKLIMSGHPATYAASEIGFNDYSGFYKQYKKMFGTSPSDKAKNLS